MSQTKLPPLNLNSPRSVGSNESNSNASINLSARQRRRNRLQNQNINQSKTQTNKAFESDEDTNKNKKLENPLENLQKARRARKSTTNNTTTEDTTQKPPIARKKLKKPRQTNFSNRNHSILQGLEDDVIEMDEEEKKEVSDKDQFASDLSQRDLITENENITKSVPTDKFYLELEKKFTIQKKELFEKRENERLAQIKQAQIKQQQKEELKYQISTTRTALYTHKFLRLIFLFIHGINVGFQIWQTIVVYFVNLTEFKIELGYNTTQINNQASLSIMILFENLIMPIHCLSYFFLTICIVDSMDRVDFTKMNLKYLIKCLSFQNQFWSIVFYIIAILISLSIIFVDESAYISSSLDNTNFLNRTNTYFLDNITTNSTVWKSVSIVKAVFSLLGWLLISIFVKLDKTCESLEKRDFDILDDIADTTSIHNSINQTSNA